MTSLSEKQNTGAFRHHQPGEENKKSLKIEQAKSKNQCCDFESDFHFWTM